MTAVNPGAGTNSTANVAGRLNVVWVDSGSTAVLGPQGQNVPLGAGGVAISAGANSQSSGTINFSNANGVTFGMDGAGNITATVTPGAAAGIAAVNAGTQTQTSGTLVFSNSNGLTFGMSNSSVITASYTVPSQTNQTIASGNIAGTGFTSTTTGGVVIVGTNSTNGLSLGVPNWITTYVAQTTQTQPAGNIAGAGTTTTTQAGSTLGATQNSNGLSLAVPLWITTYAQSTQTQPAGNIAGIGTTTTTQGGSTLGATLSTNGLSLAVPAWLTAAAGGGGFTGGVSTGGNTLGNTGSQTGSIFFAGGNNITLSVSTAAGGAQTITISGPNAGGAQTGISGIIVSNTTYTSGTVSFSNANGISFGSSAGQAITASYTVPATAGLISGLNVSGGAGNSQSNVTGMTFNNANGMTFGVSTGANIVTVTGSYTVPTVTNSSWTVSDANTSATVGRLAFTQANGLTLSLSTSNNGNHTVFGSYTVPSTTGLISAVNISGNGTSGNVTQIVYSNLNGMTFGVSTAGGGPIGTVTASYTVPSVTQYFSNTGTTFNGANVSGSLTLNTAGLQVSLSVAPGGGGGFSGGVSNIGNTLGNTGTQTGTIVFAGGNNITLSVATAAGGAQTITISGANAGGAQTGISSLQNSQTTYTSGAVKFLEGGGAITIASSTGQAFNFSVPQTSSLVGTQGISVSTVGSTISIIGQAQSTYVPWTPASTGSQTIVAALANTSASMFVYPFSVENRGIAFDVVNIGVILSNSASAATSLGWSATQFYGIYSSNVSTLSLISSSSFSLAITSSGASGTLSYPSATGTAGYTYTTTTATTTAQAASLWGQNGTRVVGLQFGNTMSLSRGMYWLGLLSINSSSGHAGGQTGALVGNVWASMSSAGGIGQIISNDTTNWTNRNPWGPMGAYTVSQNTVPASIAFSNVNNTVTIMPMMSFLST